MSEEVSGPPIKPRVPKRILYFSDGTLEEYSSEEEEVDSKNNKQVVNPETLTWAPWILYQSTFIGNKLLEVCDYFGESLASFFGIITPKYQSEIEHYKRMLAEEEELKKKQDLEMGGWTADTNSNNVIDSQMKMTTQSLISEERERRLLLT